MSEQKTFLKNVHIKNFLSLRGVTLPLKPLTILVGANASGKSSVLRALRLLKNMMVHEYLPSVDAIQQMAWMRARDHFGFQLETIVEGTPTLYELALRVEADDRTLQEELKVGDVDVISLQDGTRIVRDEDGKSETTYKPNKLALKSAGDYGNKPITHALKMFISGWEFYDIEPDTIKAGHTGFPDSEIELLKPVDLASSGATLSELLSYWHNKEPGLFENVSRALSASTHISLDYREINGRYQTCLSEGYKDPVSLLQASDGTLRLMAYNALLNQPELPPFIAIEEPERSLHPGALTHVAGVLKALAERTQVIITTHSSQLLDAFNLSESLGVLLLRNRPGLGTFVLNVEERRDKQEAFKGWIADFGIGSAIFDSALLQELMREPV